MRNVMGKVILVLSDGLGDDPARLHMGFLEHWVEERRATRMTSRAAIPTNSRPNYETLHTGVSPSVHGITSNLVMRSSSRPNTFSLATRAGLTTAAVAYSWFSELYVRAPFDPSTDMEVSDPAGPIQEGRFYFVDEHPDEDVFARAATLVARRQPDYVLIHPMGCDIAGHDGGGSSAGYAKAIEKQDAILATAIPLWTALGYTTIVTSDHGHRSEGGHGGTGPEVVNTPLYVVPPSEVGQGDTAVTVMHTQIAPTVWAILGLGGTPADAAAPIDLGPA
jgi:predicted AlkP superfamily pyrophosphatase or phosphodiesterase